MAVGLGLLSQAAGPIHSFTIPWLPATFKDVSTGTSEVWEGPLSRGRHCPVHSRDSLASAGADTALAWLLPRLSQDEDAGHALKGPAQAWGEEKPGHGRSDGPCGVPSYPGTGSARHTSFRATPAGRRRGRRPLRLIQSR